MARVFAVFVAIVLLLALARVFYFVPGTRLITPIAAEPNATPAPATDPLALHRGPPARTESAPASSRASSASDAGSVHVRIVDSDGALLLHPLKVLVRASREGTRTTVREALTSGGTCEVPVALDRELGVTAQVGYRWLRQKVLAGPTRETPRVACTLACSRNTVLLRGRLIDDTRKPFANKPFLLHLGMMLAEHDESLPAAPVLPPDTEKLGEPARPPITTGGNGEFAWILDLHADQEEDVSLHFECDNALARVTLPRRALRTAHDCGDVVLHRPRELIGGMVVDPDGVPIGKGVHVSVEGGEADERTGEWRVGAWTAADGRFGIRGWVGTAPLRLRISADGFLPSEELEISLRKQTSRVVLRRAGVVILTTQREGLVLRRQGTGETISPAREGQRSAWQHLVAGTYDLVDPGSGKVLVDALDIRAGVTCDDRRLAEIDR